MHSRRDIFLALATSVATVAAGPCDIYAQGGTPCVAAHSTTRALYGAFNGPLYQVIRGSDNTTLDISTLGAGGIADSGAQDTFCANTTCLIKQVYDQSGRGNILTKAPPGGAANGPEPDGDNLASATGAPATLGGKKVYGLFSSPGTGYRNNKANGTAIGDEPQGIYAVFAGNHYNDRCCFDYGNAELNSTDTGNGHMEALYFGGGGSSLIGTGAGDGPWVMADLENGVFPGTQLVNQTNDPTVNYRFLTAILKGEPGHWALRGGDATSGPISTFFDGPRPSGGAGNYTGYDPMSKEGSIILGIGGDNSDSAQGTFYEGVMTSGYPSDDTEQQVQTDIRNAGYATSPLTSGAPLTAGQSISVHATTPGFTTRYLTHNNVTIDIEEVSSGSTDDLKAAASWVVRAGLWEPECFSFESKDVPGSFIRQANFTLGLAANDNSKLFKEDTTFCPQASFNGQGLSFRSWNFPTRFWRHFNGTGYIGSNGGVEIFDAPKSFTDDASWVVSAGFVAA